MKKLILAVMCAAAIALVLELAWQRCCTPKEQRPQQKKLGVVEEESGKPPDNNVFAVTWLLHDPGKRSRFFYYDNTNASYLTGGIITAKGQRYDVDWFEEKDLLVLRVENGEEHRLHSNGTLEGCDSSGQNRIRANAAMREILGHFDQVPMYHKKQT